MSNVVLSTSVNVSPELAWAVLDDVSRWPKWDPAFVAARLENGFFQGESIAVRLANGQRRRLRIEVMQPCRRLALAEKHCFGWSRLTYALERSVEGARLALSLESFGWSSLPEDDLNERLRNWAASARLLGAMRPNWSWPCVAARRGPVLRCVSDTPSPSTSQQEQTDAA